MSQRSEIYREFRERIKTLGELAGQQSTNDLLMGIDQMWRTLLRVRSAMIKTLVIQQKIESGKDVSAEDFASLYLQIHNPKREARLCEHCCGLVEFGISTCPYCGEHVNGQNSNEFIASISIDIQAKPKGPNWNIDYSAKEMLEKARLKEEFDRTPVAVPRATRFEELSGPKGTTGEVRDTNPNRKRLSRSASLLVRWLRRRELCSRFPFTSSQLVKLKQKDLKLLANVFKDKSSMAAESGLVNVPNEELIRIILAHQPQEPMLDIGPPPIGEIPELEGDDIDGE